MYTFKRKLATLLEQRLYEPPQRIQIVGGPRQTGKTVLVRQVCNDIYSTRKKGIHFCAVDNPESSSRLTTAIAGRDAITAAPEKPDIKWLVHQWEKARRIAESEEFINQGCVLVLDEIQKIPRWSEAVKGLWDQDRFEDVNLHVVLLGSSPLLMQQGLTESLAGRYEFLRNTHWSFQEMSEAFNFDIDEYVYFGGYPGGASLIRDEPRWLSYVRHGLIEPNIEKDILMMTRVNKPILLKNAFELGCEYSGQIFAYEKMRGQLTDAGNVTTLAHYMELLSKAGLITGLQSFFGNKRRRRASKPKLNVMNTALMACYSGYSFADARADRTFWGRMVESAVGAHLVNTCPPEYEIYYWRDRGYEVDFVLHQGGKLLAIEVKSGAQKQSIKGLDRFVAEYGWAMTMLVGGNGVSLQEFLSYPAIHWLKV